MIFTDITKLRRDAARQRAIMARKFPCVCRGKGCLECAGRGHLYDRQSYAQTVNLRSTELSDDLSGELPF